MAEHDTAGVERDGTADAPAPADAIDDELDRLARERDEYLDALRRLQAEFENYRKQSMRRETQMIERANEKLVEELLPVLDTFELALQSLLPDSSDDAPDAAKLRKGVELVFAELIGVLEKAGLERIDALGKPFDPHEHEAVMQEGGDGEPVVADVMRTGYRHNGRVLRAAMVKVAHTGTPGAAAAGEATSG